MVLSLLRTGFYKYVGDPIVPPGDNSFVKLSLKKPMPLFSGNYSELYVRFSLFVQFIVKRDRPKRCVICDKQLKIIVFCLSFVYFIYLSLFFFYER